MLKSGLKTRFAVAFVAMFLVAGGAYAFTAANTVPSSTAGAGASTVSGYTVSGLHYALDATTPTNIDSLTFTVAPVIPSTGTGKVIVQAALSTGGPTNYVCTTDLDRRNGYLPDDDAAVDCGPADGRDRRRRSVAATA